MKYIGIKIKGLDHWLWFEKSKVSEASLYFCATEGWGKDGEVTSIGVDTNLIEGRITSNALQFNEA